MKTLLVQRHAKSSWKDRGLDDHDRPLNKRGKKDAPRMGRLVREQGLIPDLILSSTAVRAKNTAKEVAKVARYPAKIQWDGRLYLATPSDIVGILKEVTDLSSDRVMIVGHNPGQEELVRLLTGSREAFPTAALAQIELPITTWGGLELSTKGRLIRLWRPKELGD